MSMDFTASRLEETTIDGEPCKMLSSVFSNAETSPYLPAKDPCDPPLDNPAFRADLSLNVSNGNAGDIIEALGYMPDSEFWHAPIDEVMARTTQYLRDRLGAQTPAIDRSVSAVPGQATIIDCGRPAGYLEAKIQRLAVLIREGKARGATHVSAA